MSTMSEATLITQPSAHFHAIQNAKLMGNSYILSHEELVSQNLLEILEENHEMLDKVMKDAIIMMLIEHILDLQD